MTKSYVRQIKLRRWFPPNDRFAASVARLCILREDLFLEMAGIYAHGIEALDSHSVLWRRMYFWRHLVKTVGEIRQTIDTLNMVPEFRSALKAQPPKRRKEFDRIVKKLAQEQLLVKKTRDSLGGHVLHQTVEQALNDMPLDTFSYIEVGRIAKKTHYRFAAELVVEMLLAGVPQEKREVETERHFQTIADLLPVFTLTDIILTMYAGARHLVD